MLVGRLLGGVSAMSWPPIMICPEVGVSRPEIIRSSVVLPQPDGPSSAKNSFWSMSKEMLSTAMTPPANFLDTLRMETMGSVMVQPLPDFSGAWSFIAMTVAITVITISTVDAALISGETPRRTSE